MKDLINNVFFGLSYPYLLTKKEMDRKLKELIEEQVKNARPLSDKIIKNLQNARYSSGRMIKWGDIFFFLLSMETSQYNLINEKESYVFKIVVFNLEEIDEVCRNYEYVKGERDTIFVKKINENGK